VTHATFPLDRVRESYERGRFLDLAHACSARGDHDGERAALERALFLRPTWALPAHRLAERHEADGTRSLPPTSCTGRWPHSLAISRPGAASPGPRGVATGAMRPSRRSRAPSSSSRSATPTGRRCSSGPQQPTVPTRASQPRLGHVRAAHRAEARRPPCLRLAAVALRLLALTARAPFIVSSRNRNECGHSGRRHADSCVPWVDRSSVAAMPFACERRTRRVVRSLARARIRPLLNRTAHSAEHDDGNLSGWRGREDDRVTKVAPREALTHSGYRGVHRDE
jgi:hypothetical protein